MESGGTAIGIKCKDGVVLAVEKIVLTKLLKSGANKRIGTVDRHGGIVSNPFLQPSNFFVLINVGKDMLVVCL